MAKVRGPDFRVIHELALGERRVDLAFVYPHDIVGVEIKGPRDSLGDGRVSKQLREYSFYLPEVWLVIDEKWEDHASVESYEFYGNVLVYRDGKIERKRGRNEVIKDELCCSRVLELLWQEEAARIAARTSVMQGQLARRTRKAKLHAVLARMLTGHEAMREACTEIRARPMHMVGIGSSEPIITPARSPSASGPRPAARLL